MINKSHQEKGYGLLSLQLVIQELRRWATRIDKQTVTLGHDPTNDRAALFFDSAGFLNAGETTFGEKIRRLTLFQH